MRSRNLRPGQENGNTCPDPLAPLLSSARSTLRIQCAFVLLLAAASVALAIGVVLWLQRTEYFWRDPITDARFQAMTDSTAWIRLLRSPATVISWRFCRTGTDRWTYCHTDEEK